MFNGSSISNANDMDHVEQDKPCVIVLHGLARTAQSMQKIASELKSDYHVINHTYPSRKHPIDKLAELAIAPAVAHCQKASTINFVTHSLGGILVRQYLSENKVENLNHVVMLGPPNNGSELVDYFQTSKVANWFFDSANGPAGAQLGTQEGSLPIALGKVDFSLGVIAGNVSYSPMFSRIIDGENDGKVSVKNSMVEGMADHLVLPTSHTFMMRNPDVIKQVKHYLKNGRFEHDLNE